MKLRLLHAFLALFLLLAGTASAWAVSPSGICASPGVPDHANVSWVAPEVGVDGLPMAILMLRADQPPATLLNWYAAHWHSLSLQSRPIRYPSGPWQVVARRIGGCFETIQAQTADGGGTLAYIGISRLHGAASAAHLEVGIPAPAGAQTLLNMRSQDAARQGHTLLLSLPMSTLAALDFYTHALSHGGWSIQMHHLISASQATLMAQRHAQQIEMALSVVQGKTYALLTVVEN
ncbi:MAG: hypothetical protein J0I24_15620 [Thiomonas arsenitoxydans]|uniref:Secreted protein n=1 Tax=Thiomonas arsenitoxydans (strain DSM 22701 / CIP 110005 / 3As) TaxID=426114 RepID=A0A8I1SWR3_THIA3|nr:hypothetical protein [Thiomonas arsenitoxydans]MBN8745702.1 hypothetical protein [Thiomonas arsenitoxydans]ODU55473.1 MAG: hypothetical protein ABT04_00745 [Granulicella sp. SCN 62-9]